MPVLSGFRQGLFEHVEICFYVWLRTEAGRFSDYLEIVECHFQFDTYESVVAN